MKHKSLLMMMLLSFAFLGVARAQELTVHDGSATSGYVPVYGWYADAFLKSEMVYPATELTVMVGKSIYGMSFYASQSDVDWGAAQFQVFMAEVADATISAYAGPGTIVYEGALSIAEGQMNVEFTTPYTYAGGNLLVGVYLTTKGSYVTSTWKGETVTGASVQGYSYSSLDEITPTQRDFLPKTTFLYVGDGPTCDKPATLEVSDISGYGATFTWESSVGNYTFEYKKSSESDWTVVSGLTTNTYTLSTLEPATPYNVRVKAVCDVDLESGYKTANFTTLDVCPDDVICIGEGENTSSYLPTYCFYNYSFTEQIYTAEEIGAAAAVEGIDLHCSNTITRNFDIYMVSTEKTAFENGSDWIAVTESDKVFSGTVAFNANTWQHIKFDNPFIFDGSNNVALVVDDNTGTYQSGPSFYVFDAPNQAIRVYSDGTNYDPTAPSSYSGAVMNVKNRVRLTMGEPPTCFKPTSFTATEVTNHTATLVWNSDADSWELDMKGEIIEVDEPTYTFTDLAAETTFTVKVRANCGDGDYSDWAETSFTTDIACPQPTELEVTPATFSAEVSWDAEYTDEFELWYREMPEGAVGFEDGTLGDWTTIDADGDGSTWFAWTSTEMEVGHGGSDYVATSASYAGTALNPDNYLVSPQVTLGGSITFWACAQDAAWPSEHYGVAVSTTGNTDAADFETIFETDMTAKAGVAPTKAGVAPTKDTRSGNRELGNWYEITVDLSAYAGKGYVAIRHFDCTDWFRLNVDDINILEPGAAEPEWVVVNPATNPFEITGLTPETTYEVKVRSLCGEDGYSEWAQTSFTTISPCAVPEDLEVTHLMPTSASLNWTGYQDGYEVWYRPVVTNALAAQDFEDSSLGDWTTIDSDGDGYDWVLASDAAGVYHNEGVDLSGYGHGNSEDFVCSGSYSNYAGAALTPDNYLVSPQVELVGSISFWAQAQDASYAAEHFGVAVSTTSNSDPADFVMLDEWTMTAKGNGPKANPATTRSGESLRAGTWYRYTVDLSAYAGQTGYVAIRHFNCTDQFILNVDDIVISGVVEETDWIENTCEGSPFDISGLEPETQYEWQVRGVERNCGEGYTEWSETVTFTTPGLCDNPNSFEFETLEGTTATLTWTGYQESYYVSYRPAEVAYEFFDDFSEDFVNWTGNNLSSDNYVTAVTSSGIMGYVMFWDDELGAQTMISKELEPTPSGTSLTFFAATAGVSTYKVGYSSTTNALASFTWSEELTCPDDNSFHEFEDENVPEGTKYIAVQFVSNEPDDEGYSYMIVTYFDLYALIAEAGEWVDLTVNEPSVTMEPLIPETEYEVYVQGICGEGEEDVTDWVGGNFTTPEQELIPITEIYINNFVEPQWGAYPDYGVTVPQDAPYAVDYMDWNYYDIVEDDGDIMLDDQAFDNENMAYYAYFDIVPAEGYAFADEVAVYINGDTEIAEAYGYNEQMGYYYIYTKDYYVTEPAPVEIEQTLEISAGWTWWSTYLEASDALFTEVKDAIAATNTSATIKSSNNSIMYQGGAWQENQMNPLVLENESMYMINLENTVTATVSAMAADPANHPITLAPGWNWIGFISTTPMTVEEALADLSPNNGDVIKGTATSSYTSHWNNPFDMIPGEGYMYNNCGTEPLTFSYPATAKAYVRSMPAERYWNTDTHRHATNLVVMATLDASQYAMAEGNYEIGAFVGDECRGSNRLMMADGQYVAFMVVWGEPNETIRFKLYDVTNGKELGMAEEQLTYVPNAIVGSVPEPEVLHFRGTTSLDENANSLSVYPNPAKDKVMIEGQAIEMVSVYNALGQCLLNEVCTNADNVELNLSSLSAGVYTVAIRMNGQTVNKMIVKE